MKRILFTFILILAGFNVNAAVVCESYSSGHWYPDPAQEYETNFCDSRSRCGFAKSGKFHEIRVFDSTGWDCGCNCQDSAPPPPPEPTCPDGWTLEGEYCVHRVAPTPVDNRTRARSRTFFDHLA